MVKVIWVAGMPRSGSMWTFNVVRELARRAGFCVLPKEVPLDDQDCVDYSNREIAANRDQGTVFVLKVHSLLHDVPEGDLVITNIRDIRDALLSFMRFMHVDFEQAFERSKGSIRTADHYVDMREHRRMVLRYDELTAEPAATVSRLAERIGLAIDDEEAGSIAAQFSKEKVRALTEHKDRLFREAQQIGRAPPRDVLFSRADGRQAVLDRVTGFQSDHVSDYRDGDWRHVFSATQIGMMDDAFGDWLARHGYTAGPDALRDGLERGGAAASQPAAATARPR